MEIRPPAEMGEEGKRSAYTADPCRHVYELLVVHTRLNPVPISIRKVRI